VKAILCTRLGGPDDLVLADLAVPIAGAGEAVVNIKAVGLNFYDTLIIAGKYQPSRRCRSRRAANLPAWSTAWAPELRISRPATGCWATPTVS
jgi:hypothetical protein